MGCDRGDSFPFDFEPNRIPFGSNLKGKLSPRSHPIQCERKWNTSFLSVRGATKYSAWNKRGSIVSFYQTICMNKRGAL